MHNLKRGLALGVAWGGERMQDLAVQSVQLMGDTDKRPSFHCCSAEVFSGSQPYWTHMCKHIKALPLNSSDSRQERVEYDSVDSEMCPEGSGQLGID